MVMVGEAETAIVPGTQTTALCERCGKNPVEWQCQVCRKAVCTQCVRVTDKGVFCLDHVPTTETQTTAPATSGGEGIKSAIYTLLVLEIGVGVFYFLSTVFMGTGTDIPGNVFGLKDLLKAFQGMFLLVLGGIGLVIAVLVIAYFATRRKQ
ncbi:MAG: hypothetical protein HY362_00905 [Candidatus Aenigmarchaeota archaeon]|nr:hypothetical protein [Candidatus Aenigmarchaeota archaeon]